MLGKKTLALLIGTAMVFTVAPQVQAQEPKQEDNTVSVQPKEDSPDTMVGIQPKDDLPSTLPPLTIEIPSAVDPAIVDFIRVASPSLTFVHRGQMRGVSVKDTQTVKPIISSPSHSPKFLNTGNKFTINKAKAVTAKDAAIDVKLVRFGPARSVKLTPLEFHTYADKALTLNGITDPIAKMKWEIMLFSLASKESGFKVDAANLWDSNAVGLDRSDGIAENASRGLMQLTPTVFAKYHVFGTDYNIYDPVSNIAATINYMKYSYGMGNNGDGVIEFTIDHLPNMA